MEMKQTTWQLFPVTDKFHCHNIHREVYTWVLEVEVICVCVGFAFYTFGDWSKKLAPRPQTMRSKTKTNSDLLAHVFPSPHWINAFVWSFDWFTALVKWWLWFWCYGTQLKTALLIFDFYICQSKQTYLSRTSFKYLARKLLESQSTMMTT